MRNALGLMLASVVAAVVIAGVWFWTSSPRADAAAPQTVSAPQAEPLPAAAARPGRQGRCRGHRGHSLPRRAASPAPAPAPVAAQPKAACANPDALGVSRTVVIDTTGGPGFGFEHFKQLDFLTDKEVVLTFDDGPWPTHAGGAEGAGRRMHQGRVLPDRQARDLSSGNPEAGRRGRAHRRLPHLVACAISNSKKMTEQQVKDEIEKGFSAVKMALGAAPVAVLPLPGAAAYAGGDGLSRLAQHRDVLRATSIPSTSGPSDADADHQDRDDQARQAGQGHHPDARFAKAHRARPCRPCCAG